MVGISSLLCAAEPTRQGQPGAVILITGLKLRLSFLKQLHTGHQTLWWARYTTSQKTIPLQAGTSVPRVTPPPSARVSFQSSHQDQNLTKSSELTPTASMVPPNSPLKPDTQERGQSNPPPPEIPNYPPLHPAHPRAEQLEVTQPLTLTVKRAGPGQPNHPKQGKPAQIGESGK